MKKTSIIYHLFFIVVLAFISACSVGNKALPDPSVISVDTTNTTLNSFKVYVTGDTSFVMDCVSLDSLNFIKNDTLKVINEYHIGTALKGGVLFQTFTNTPGIYYTEGAPPGITGAEFILVIVINGSKRYFVLNHGNITITSHDTTKKEVKGNFDVNNLYFPNARVYLRAKGYFYISYK